MTISNKLLQNPSFRQNLETDFKSLEQSIEKGTVWNCGITSKGITIVNKNAPIIAKIIFIIKKLFCRIDTSYASMQDLKQRAKLAELTELNDKIAKAQQNLASTTEQVATAEKDWQAKSDQVRDVTRELSSLQVNASNWHVTFNSLKSDSLKLDQEIEAKKKELEVLEGKLKAIAKEEMLETQLQAKRTACQEVTKEIEEIAKGLAAKHAEFMDSIGKTVNKITWLTNAKRMIREKRESLEGLYAKDTRWKPSNSFEFVLNSFKMRLKNLGDEISLLTSSKEFADVLSELQVMQTTGWKEEYYGHVYTVLPKDHTHLQKTIMRELKELAVLTFTRKQLMALAK